MSDKTVPYSVRLSQDDADFLASFSVPGAVTPSDKLRAIISAARERADGTKEYQGCLRNFGELTGKALLKVKQFEEQEGMHSEIVGPIAEWSQELLALFTARVHATEGSTSRESLIDLEKTIADRTFLLIDKILRMGITKRSNCYEEDAITKRLASVLEIAEVLLKTKQ